MTSITNADRSMLVWVSRDVITFDAGTGLWFVDDRGMGSDDMAALERLVDLGLVRRPVRATQGSVVTLTALGEESAR